MHLKYETASEPLHISVNWLFLNTDVCTGITDNAIMILAEDAIEDFIAQKIGL